MGNEIMKNETLYCEEKDIYAKYFSLVCGCLLLLILWFVSLVATSFEKENKYLNTNNEILTFNNISYKKMTDDLKEKNKTFENENALLKEQYKTLEEKYNQLEITYNEGW
jgi:hypothetical protein